MRVHDHLLPLRNPANGARERKECGEHAGGKSESLQRDAGIEVDVGIEPLLDEIFVLERDALELEKIALSDPYFIDRKLYPNVDFYSGITLKAMGVPTSMFTVLFAVARTVGWISQWSEMIEDPHQKIGRPRQLYTGVARRDYVDIGKRK